MKNPKSFTENLTFYILNYLHVRCWLKIASIDSWGNLLWFYMLWHLYWSTIVSLYHFYRTVCLKWKVICQWQSVVYQNRWQGASTKKDLHIDAIIWVCHFYAIFIFHINLLLLLFINKGRFCNNSEIYTLISKGLSVETTAKLSQLTRTDFATIAKFTH